MAFGADVIFAAGLGFVLLGPKRMHTLLGHVARVKAHVDTVRRDLATQLDSAVDASASDPRAHQSEITPSSGE